MSELPGLKVGVAGTGFVGANFVTELLRRGEWSLAKIYTRRPASSIEFAPDASVVTNDLHALVDASDVVFEATGDPSHAAATVKAAIDAGKPVVTLNAEFHATCGSAFAASGLLSEAAGDQPGCLAELDENARAMGFEPLVYGNMKGFLKTDPTREDMVYWGGKQNFSIEMVTSFTDGTKVNIEQCLAANGLGAGLYKQGMLAIAEDDLQKAANFLGAKAEEVGHPITEFVVSGKLPHGIFIVAKHDERQSLAFQNYKMGKGPYYLLSTNFCMVYLEAFKTIERMMTTKKPLLTNSAKPKISVASIAKRELKPGETVERGCGGFDLRGECVEIARNPGHVPICLANGARVRRKIEKGRVVTEDDLELKPSLALDLWRDIERRSLARNAA